MRPDLVIGAEMRGDDRSGATEGRSKAAPPCVEDDVFTGAEGNIGERVCESWFDLCIRRKMTKIALLSSLFKSKPSSGAPMDLLAPKRKKSKQGANK